MELFTEILKPIAITLLTGIATVAARRLLRWFDLAEDQALRQNLETALVAAASAAYAKAVGRGIDMDSAIGAGANYVAERMPQTLAKLGVPESAIPSMVEARFGKLLAADPTVSATRQ